MSDTTIDSARPIPKLARPEVTYTIPEDIRAFETDPKAVTMRPITVREELDANAIVSGAKNAQEKLVLEIVRKSVFKVDGKEIDYSTDAPEWIERASPKVVNLVTEAVLRLNRPSKEETDLFFKSATKSSG